MIKPMGKNLFHVSSTALKGILFLAILTAIFMLLKDVDWKRTRPILATIDVVPVIVVFLLGGMNIFLVTLRWHILLKVVKKNISFRNVIVATIGATAINTAGPGKLGVPAKAILIKKLEGVEINQSIPSVLMDLFIEILAMFLLLVVSALAIGMHTTVWRFAAAAFTGENIFYTGGLLILVMLVVYLLRHKIAANDFIRNLVAALQKTLRRKDIFALALGISFLNLLVHFWADQLLFKALQQDIPFGFVVFSSAFSAMAGLLSPLPSGLGVWELSRAYLFKTYYHIGELAVIMTLLRRLLTYTVMGVIYCVSTFFVTRDKNLAIPEMADHKVLPNGLAGD
ncbi:MAG: flippase-like domain-containing protein [candidate division KSB1 bacterium]|nr:flippase-like domain-containing protein [candidate division KSB1 bacterium]